MNLIEKEIRSFQDRVVSCGEMLPPEKPDTCGTPVPYTCFRPFASKFRDGDQCYCFCDCGCGCITLKASTAYAWQKWKLGEVVDSECCTADYECAGAGDLLEALKSA